ncbi:MAG: Gfo/Idh/MocA family oxidoreductase [Rheinheimera sp.]|nr:Gfo/Idh/MocA family oxidoreductase [Rheinheimera sp.]
MSQQRAEQPTVQQQVTPIRYGMVGGGEGAFIGAVHRHAAALDGHYQLVCGAFSRDEANNRRTAAALSLPLSRCYANVEQMLSSEAALPVNERMQVVVIVTPNHSHVPMSLCGHRRWFSCVLRKACWGQFGGNSAASYSLGSEFGVVRACAYLFGLPDGLASAGHGGKWGSWATPQDFCRVSTRLAHRGFRSFCQ